MRDFKTLFKKTVFGFVMGTGVGRVNTYFYVVKATINSNFVQSSLYWFYKSQSFFELFMTEFPHNVLRNTKANFTVFEKSC
ncbi:hypothetical protein SAMN06295933_3580 [Desulfovibrio gilichinskyi]|uniref:Uncharacterized protein n=1 Tax=Desulfovibrio gilichinskyi TaxID=1519643 RepID=A0A1X7F2G7_9BACT|nr:hypothetical protein SAMN06295933_3580 [Desulfovibrio gilichinskyi]